MNLFPYWSDGIVAAQYGLGDMYYPAQNVQRL